MGFIELLNKCGDRISIEKTSLYQDIKEVKTSLEVLGLDVKIKDEFDLFHYEIIYRGMLTQNMIENAYEVFLNQNYDLLDYLKYDEKQRMFNNDLQSLLKDVPCFIDHDSNVPIYIPYLEAFINKRYVNDYQMLLLKQHRDYIRSFSVNVNTPVELYGKHIYFTDFSSLEVVYEDHRHICFYFDQLKKIYIYSKEIKELLNSLIIQDMKSHANMTLDLVKKIIYDIENYHYKECLELLKDNGLICQKTYKKIMKFYK